MVFWEQTSKLKFLVSMLFMPLPLFFYTWSDYLHSRSEEWELCVWPTVIVIESGIWPGADRLLIENTLPW